MNDDYQSYLLTALEQVETWGTPEEAVAEEANALARLMAGEYQYEGCQSEIHSFR